jgi:GntR family transcriptional regulator, transcriptional repressor for pyruvate dehydrogenase complex
MDDMRQIRGKSTADVATATFKEQFKEVRSSRLYEDVVAQFEDLIRKGELKPGTRLPSERSLSEHMNVSRNILREAFRLLEYQGFIQVRAGAGRYVRDIDPNSAIGDDKFKDVARASLSDAIGARKILEPSIARLAALHRTDRQADELRRLATVGDTWTDNANFHVAIAEATGNFVLIRLERELLEQTRQIRLSYSLSEEEKTVLKREHIDICEAIRNKDPDSAEAAAMQHVAKANRRLSL